MDGLTHKELKNNIDKVIKDIPKQKYENIIKGTYNRTQKNIIRNLQTQEKHKKIINN